MKLPAPLRVPLARSRIAYAALAASHGATLALLCALPLPAAIRIGAGSTVAAAFLLSTARVAGSARVVALAVGLDRRIGVARAGGDTLQGEILDASYVGRWLTTIVWRPDGSRRARAVVVLADALPADTLRRLRVVLRYSRSGEGGSSDVDAA